MWQGKITKFFQKASSKGRSKDKVSGLQGAGTAGHSGVAPRRVSQPGGRRLGLVVLPTDERGQKAARHGPLHGPGSNPIGGRELSEVRSFVVR